MTDYSHAWTLECLIRLMDAEDLASLAETAFAIKGDTERTEKMRDVKERINELMSQIAEIANTK